MTLSLVGEVLVISFRGLKYASYVYGLELLWATFACLSQLWLLASEPRTSK